jgi:hypothetical protein
VLCALQFLFGEIELRGKGFHLREILDLKYFTIADTEASLSLTKIRECLIRIRFRLLDCLPLLFDLGSSLLQLDLSITRIEAKQHTALLDVAADIEIHLDNLAGDSRGDIGLRIARQITRRLNVRRDRDDARLGRS